MVDDERLVAAFHFYMGEDAFGYRDLADNLHDKLSNPEFQDDLSQLVIEPPGGYNLTEAADMVMERLGAHLRGAPAEGDIAGGAWRGSD